MRQKVEITIGEICYYIFFAILFFAKAIGLYDGQTCFKVCLVIALLFVMIKIVLTPYSVQELVISMALILLGMIVYRNSGEKSALVFLIMMIGLKGIPWKRIVRVGLVVWGIGFFGLLAATTFGLHEDMILVHHKLGMDIIRRGLGYSHPNVLHVSYAILAVLIMNAVNSRDKLKVCIGVFIGNIIIFLYSLSYTGFMLTSIFMVFNIYFTYRKTLTKLEKGIIYGIYPICILFSLVMPVIMDPNSKFFQFLNNVLNQRFYASRIYLEQNELTFLGKRIFCSNSFALDNSYVTLLLYGGILLFGIISAGYIFTINYEMKNRDWNNLGLVLAFSIAGVIEPFLFNFSFKNLSLLVIADVLWKVSNGNGRIFLLSKYNRKIQLNMIIPRGKRTINRKRVYVILIFCILAGTITFLMEKVPKAVYVNEQYCDIEGEVYYIEKEEYEVEKDVKFYQYQDETIGMYRLSNETILFDRIRNIIGISSLIFIMGCCALLIGKFLPPMKNIDTDEAKKAHRGENKANVESGRNV